MHHSANLLRSIAIFAAALASVSARADTPDVQIGGGINNNCGPSDIGCAKRIEHSLSDGHVRPIEVSSGVVFGQPGQGGAAVRFGTELFGIDQLTGDAHTIVFDASYVQDGGLRVRFTLADTQVTYLCHDQKGKTLTPPFSIKPLGDCKPEPGSAMATIGAGGTLVQIQVDEATRRVAARWADLHAVINLLQNAGTQAYLRKRLEAYAGVNVDTLFYGNAPGAHGGSATLPRYGFGVSGLYRSDDYHWQIDGLAGFRQDVLDLSDYSFEARAQALYEILYSPKNIRTLNVGVDAEYQYNSDPLNSIGDFVSDRNRHSAYLGAILGFKFD
jgi:hypothetical protein